MEVAARLPDGATEILLLTKNPSVEWPTPYILKTPRLLRRGTEIAFVVRKRVAADDHIGLTISRF